MNVRALYRITGSEINAQSRVWWAEYHIIFRQLFSYSKVTFSSYKMSDAYQSKTMHDALIVNRMRGKLFPRNARKLRGAKLSVVSHLLLSFHFFIILFMPDGGTIKIHLPIYLSSMRLLCGRGGGGDGLFPFRLKYGKIWYWNSPS